jgi:HTH-type transcriptional regulator/antitoxin HigA
MIQPISNSASHRRALKRIERLWDAAPGSPAELELDALATLVDAYERRTCPIDPLDPLEAIRVRCEQLGLSRRELEPLIGSRARVSEVLSGKRSLTLPMIRRLHAALGIPADVLISTGTKRPLARTRANQRSQVTAAQLGVAAGKRRKVR